MHESFLFNWYCLLAVTLSFFGFRIFFFCLFDSDEFYRNHNPFFYFALFSSSASETVLHSPRSCHWHHVAKDTVWLVNILIVAANDFQDDDVFMVLNFSSHPRSLFHYFSLLEPPSDLHNFFIAGSQANVFVTIIIHPLFQDPFTRHLHVVDKQIKVSKR